MRGVDVRPVMSGAGSDMPARPCSIARDQRRACRRRGRPGELLRVRPAGVAQMLPPAGLARIRSSAPAISSGSSGYTSGPASPTTSGSAPRSAAMTGTPRSSLRAPASRTPRCATGARAAAPPEESARRSSAEHIAAAARRGRRAAACCSARDDVRRCGRARPASTSGGGRDRRASSICVGVEQDRPGSCAVRACRERGCSRRPPARGRGGGHAGAPGGQTEMCEGGTPSRASTSPAVMRRDHDDLVGPPGVTRRERG